MTFFITAIDEQGDCREFTLMGEVETSFELFDHIEATGGTLLKVMIQQGKQLEELPLDSLKTHAWLADLDAVEGEWQLLLNEPVVNSTAQADPRAMLISNRVDRHEICIFQLEKHVVLAEERLQRVETSIHREPHRSRMLHLLEGVLHLHQHNLATERASLVRLLKRVSG